MAEALLSNGVHPASDTIALKTTTGSTLKAKNWIPIKEEPAYKARRIRIVCVGAGYSGLMIAHQVKYNKDFQGYIDVTIYDKNSDIGGTWLENKYPGVACDVPAHIYTFPFEPNPDWSTFYASGPEIWAYIKRTTRKYQLDEHVQLRSKVVESTWDESSGKWRLKIDKDGQIFEDECDVLINGSGFLKHVDNWGWPDIKGLRDFKGRILHSASWDSSLNWTGKRVAVIGNGSSAIQIVPQMQQTAARLTNYIRSPTWISSNFAAEFTKDGTNFSFSEEEKQQLRENPAAHLKMRKEIEHGFNKFFYALFIDSPQQKAALAQARKLMRERLQNNQELCDKLIPPWQLGCRRLTPGDDYLEALQAPNTSCNFGPILRITENGIQSQDSHDEYDIIICATGFEVSFRPPWKMQGRNGCQLSQEWGDSPEAYFGIAAADHPNYFIFNGPNSPVGHGSLLESTLCVTRWILQWCHKIATEDIKCICVKQRALEDYNLYSQEFLKRMVWSGGCRSWYKNGKVDGKVTAMYAGSVLQYREILESFRVEDFDIEYRSANRFRFMGNGITMREERGDDLSYYMEK